MKKIICKKLYDTENATIVKKVTSGELGSAEGYEETLYMSPDGSYFIYTNGGENSKYKKEDIKRASKAVADAFINGN